MLYETPTGFSIETNTFLELDHGRFLFEAPPFETEFDYIKQANSEDLIKTCWGFCRNVEGIDDCFGIGVVDKDQMSIIQGYYTDIVIPLYKFVSWETKQDQIMPNYDWNLICYVGYYRPAENVLYATDWREFTIKSTALPEPFPSWIFLLGIPIIYLAIKK